MPGTRVCSRCRLIGCPCVSRRAQEPNSSAVRFRARAAAIRAELSAMMTLLDSVEFIEDAPAVVPPPGDSPSLPICVCLVH